MRWPPLLGVLVILLAGCGGGSGGSPGKPAVHARRARLVLAGLQPPSGCYVTVFLIDNATKAQIRSVQNRLLANNGTAEVSFVSRGLALERFGMKNPKLAKSMHVNPFSDQFEVVPRSLAAVYLIIGDFARNGGPITNALPGGTCANAKR